MTTTPDPLTEFEMSLVGQRCLVIRQEYDWTFELSGGAILSVGTPWRIVRAGRIAVSSGDDRQTFGLPTPFDAEAKARELLADQIITAATLRRDTADLVLEFAEGTRIDIYNSSAGYEGWQADYDVGGDRRHLVALGGGDVARW